MISYIGLNSKIHSLTGNLLDKNIYDRLASSQSKEEFFGILFSTDSYSKIAYENFDKLQDVELFAIGFKLVIFNSLSAHCLNFRSKKFINAFFKKIEAGVLKKILYSVINKNCSSGFKFNTLQLIKYFNGKFSLNFETLIECKSIFEVIGILKDSEYRATVTAANIIYEKNHSIFAFESGFDLFYFTNLFSKIDKLSGAEKNNLLKILNYQADLLNITLFYRGKFNYKMSAEQVLSLKIGFKNYKPFTDIVELAKTDSAYDFEKIIFKSQYKNILNEKKSINDVSLETECFRLLYEVVKKYICANNFGISALYAYLLILDFEIRDITVLYENLKYRFEKNELNSFLIRNFL